MSDLLPVGTRIRFTKDLNAPANEEHPCLEFARKGEEGEITGHGTWEGYWVKRDSWPAPFGAKESEFEVINSEELAREILTLWDFDVERCSRNEWESRMDDIARKAEQLAQAVVGESKRKRRK